MKSEPAPRRACCADSDFYLQRPSVWHSATGRRPSQSGANSERISDANRGLTTGWVFSPALSEMSYQ